MNVAEEIKSRGYWQTVIRPRGEYNANRISDLSGIPDLLSRLAINRRGWDFPHLERPEKTVVGNDWVGQDTVWEHFHEMWRVTKSGQLLHLAGIRYDWDAPRYLSPFEEVKPGEQILGIGDTLHRMSEVFEFAQRWAQAIAEKDGVRVGIEIGGLLNRRLVVDHPSRGGLSVDYVSLAGEPWTWQEEVVAGATLEELWGRAREATTALLQRFRHRANSQILEDWQRKIGH